MTIRAAVGTLAIASVGLSLVACKQRSESSAGNLPTGNPPAVRAESVPAPGNQPAVRAESVPTPCCGGTGGMQGRQGMSGMHGMPGMRGMAGAPGMMGTAMMDSMQAHARMMSKMSPDQMPAMVPAHRQMVTNMLDQMTRDMHDANVKPSAAWTATADSVRQGLGRLPEMTKSQLKDFMPAQCAQVSRLIGMYKETMATAKK